MLFLTLIACVATPTTVEELIDDFAVASCERAKRCSGDGSWFERAGGREACLETTRAQFEVEPGTYDCLELSSGEEARRCVKAVRRHQCDDTGLLSDECINVIVVVEDCVP